MLAFVLVPFLYWNGVWFGRVLSDSQFLEYLNDQQKPRKIQHALTQIGEGIQRKDPGVQQWYSTVLELAKHPLSEIRISVAWVMGQDHKSDLFQKNLQTMLSDPHLLVRRNAALSLVRFGSNEGLFELRSMLQPYVIKAPVTATTFYLLSQKDWIEQGEVVAVLHDANGSIEVDAPFSGWVNFRLPPEISRIEKDQKILTISPNPDHVWESLRALYLIGREQELNLIRSILEDSRFERRVHQQAHITTQAIQSRLSVEKNETSPEPSHLTLSPTSR